VGRVANWTESVLTSFVGSALFALVVWMVSAGAFGVMGRAIGGSQTGLSIVSAVLGGAGTVLGFLVAVRAAKLRHHAKGDHPKTYDTLGRSRSTLSSTAGIRIPITPTERMRAQRRAHLVELEHKGRFIAHLLDPTVPRPVEFMPPDETHVELWEDEVQAVLAEEDTRLVERFMSAPSGGQLGDGTPLTKRVAVRLAQLDRILKIDFYRGY